MQLVDNYKDWIKSEWIDEALRIQGYKIPIDFFKDLKINKEEELGLREEMDPTEREIYKVYGTDKIFFHLLEESLFSFELDHPPWIDSNKKFSWWMTKMYPGQYIPVHKDILKKKDPHTERYWIPMFDWQPGHVFMYEEQCITNYKAGDVFLYDDPRAWHGAINLGDSVRLLMQVTTYGDKNEKSR